MASLDEFTCFPQLPIELRLQIWHYTLPGLRILEVRIPGARFAPRCSEFDTIVYQPCQNPVALHVNRESREVALKSYQLCPGSTCSYMDRSIDVLFFDKLHLGIDMSDTDRRSLRRRALQPYHLTPTYGGIKPEDCVDMFAVELHEFIAAKVEEILVVIGKDPSARSLRNGFELGFATEDRTEEDPWASPTDFGGGMNDYDSEYWYSTRTKQFSTEITKVLQGWKEYMEDESYHIPVFTPVILWATEPTKMSFEAREFYEERKEKRIHYVPLHLRAAMGNSTAGVLDAKGVSDTDESRSDDEEDDNEEQVNEEVQDDEKSKEAPDMADESGDSSSDGF